ncbi:MAG: glycosyltransferase family 4 protein [Anaerolineales bacterium]|nr:glycosyltransferase family 4 protein [Chloroflexota bacterium]MBL6982319.1 glycosyltransferase family 4 protein [Anaerolineales bacterium]
MNIAIYHNLTSGGSKREAFEFARQFVHAGHTVHLYYPSTANEQFLPLTRTVQGSFNIKLNLLSPVQLRIPGLRKYLDLVGLGVNVLRLKRLAQKVAGVIDSGEYDFAFIHHDRIVQSPYLLRYLKTPSVYFCNEPMREFYEPSIQRPYQQPKTLVNQFQEYWYKPFRWISKGLVRAEDRRNVRWASLLFANSFFSAESIYRAYGVRARVSYLGVDAEKFRPLNLERQNIVLSVGAVSPLKGYDFLIEALGLFAEAKRPKLVIVGNTASTGETSFLKELAEQRGIVVEFRVNVSEDDLVWFYNQARALVYAPVLEPFGLAPLEAMACGTPVVAVQEGGVRESVIDGVSGLLVQRDAAAFAEALHRVLNNPALARELGENGRIEVQRFWTWAHAYDRVSGHLKAFGIEG